MVDTKMFLIIKTRTGSELSEQIMHIQSESQAIFKVFGSHFEICF